MDLFIQYYFGIFSTTAQFHNQFSDVVEINHSSGASNETMQTSLEYANITWPALPLQLLALEQE